MDYSWDEQQTEIRDLAAQILSKECTPDRLTALDASQRAFDADLWKVLADAGLLGIAVEESLGGGGFGFTELCLVVEQAARVAARLHLVETAVLGALPLARFGSPELRSQAVKPFAAGAVLVTSTIRTTGDAPRGVTATSAGDGWRLRGAVSHVPLADVADLLVVEAVDDEGEPGLFLVRAGADGLRTERQSSIDRQERRQVVLDDVVVPPSDVLVAPGPQGREARDWTVARGVAARGIEMLAHAEAALALAAEYVTTRHQFGRPIGTFQAVSHRLADAYIDTQGVRLTAWRAAWLLGEELADEEACGVAAWWAADAPMRVVESAMHVHGGMSVDLDYPLHRHYLACKLGELQLGGSRRRLAALGSTLAATP